MASKHNKKWIEQQQQQLLQQKLKQKKIRNWMQILNEQKKTAKNEISNIADIY